MPEPERPLDSAGFAKAAYEAALGREFPTDVFCAPQLRWAVIGCGVIANQMADSLALAGRRIEGVANRHAEKARAFAAAHGVPRVYQTFEELYADPDIDAIYIPTPHNTHIGCLRGALAAGKHGLSGGALPAAWRGCSWSASAPRSGVWPPAARRALT